MKKLFIWTTGILLTVLTIGVGVIAHQWNTEKPFTLRLYLDREVMKLVSDSPEFKTRLGLHKLGITSHLSELDSGNKLTVLEQLPDLREIQRVANRYEGLTGQDKQTQDAVNYLFDKLITLQEYKYHNYPLDTFSGLHSRFPMFMTEDHPIDNKQHVEAYISRLADSERYFDRVIDGIRYREQMGIVPPSIVLSNVTEQLGKFVSAPVDENILLTSLKVRMMDLEDVSFDEQMDFLNRARKNIEDHVYPSYHKMIDLYADLRAVSAEGAGYWRLPDGEKAYQALLEFFTTTDMSAEEVYLEGINEVDRIQQAMLKILREDLGIESDSFKQAMAEFLSRDELYFADNDEGREQVLQHMKEANNRMQSVLTNIFSNTTFPEFDIVRSDILTEDKDPLARYYDNSIVVNLGDMKALPKNSLPVLTYHEGIPGHHYQKSLSSALQGLPIVLSETPFGAYLEGWGMYAEQLGFELGLYRSPEEVLAYLQYDLMRAARMVIDTGIHVKRWSRSQAIEYLMNEAGTSPEEAAIEVDRAIVVPGSGPMYKIGKMKILALREQMKDKLGEDFSLSEFHDIVLNQGPLPLSLLEKKCPGGPESDLVVYADS